MNEGRCCVRISAKWPEFAAVRSKAVSASVTMSEIVAKSSPEAAAMFMVRSKACRGLPFPATMTSNTLTHTDAINTFAQLRAQAADVPEMSLDEINAEITAARAERKTRT